MEAQFQLIQMLHFIYRLSVLTLLTPEYCIRNSLKFFLIWDVPVLTKPVVSEGAQRLHIAYPKLSIKSYQYQNYRENLIHRTSVFPYMPRHYSQGGSQSDISGGLSNLIPSGLFTLSVLNLEENVYILSASAVTSIWLFFLARSCADFRRNNGEAKMSPVSFCSKGLVAYKVLSQDI